jgi:hypothetical protein
MGCLSSACFHSGELRMPLRRGRLIARDTHTRIAGLIVQTYDHPGTAARLFTALGLHTVVLDDAVAELRLDSGAVVHFRQGRSPTRIALGSVRSLLRPPRIIV